MMLTWIVFSLLVGGGLAWLGGLGGNRWPRWIALAVLAVHLLALVAIWITYLGQPLAEGAPPWIATVRTAWIPQLGADYSLALDGLSLVLLLLADFLGIVGVLASWDTVRRQVGFFHFNLLALLAAVGGLFLAMDLLLFYFFWELTLVPLYFLIAVWGYERRIYAAIKFFLFTQAASLLMLLSIVGLFFVHGRATGEYTFSYFALLDTPMDYETGWLLMLGFFAAFAVKLPVVPLHTWLADAHTEAPTAGSVVLAGLVLKTGAYGFLRFLVPLFPQQAAAMAPAAMALGVVGILYAAVLAFAQTDLKRMVAYTSISHMGFLLLGVFAWNQLALQGAVVIMIAHGVSTGALFVLVGDIQHRTGTRNIARLGGLWAAAPRMGGTMMFFALAALGLPGLANFVGEILVLLGSYRVNPTLAAMATLGFVVSTVYALWMVRSVFQGPGIYLAPFRDMTPRETLVMIPMIAVTVWLGVYPAALLATTDPAVAALRIRMAVTQAVDP